MSTLHLLHPSSCLHFPALPLTSEGWPWCNESPRLFFPLASVGKWKYHQAPEGQGREVTCLFPGSLLARRHLDKCLHFSTQDYSSFQTAPLWGHRFCHIPIAIPTPCPPCKTMTSHWFGSFGDSLSLVGTFYLIYTFINTFSWNSPKLYLHVPSVFCGTLTNPPLSG